ncbi:hypothetical protein BKA70DRAFT_1412027 [Coprinopsis sp. MPI-PUGE-AT-0042]|nr:hypothetical protein BKA70DRAFT_1412027 [Coprinopsis sp. MPI-PUGE-AT-0042]
MSSTNTFGSSNTETLNPHTNSDGQGASHATGESFVPSGVQRAAPRGLEESLPESIHPTGANPNNQSTNRTHAKDGGDASIVPKKIQEKLPESIERAVPNFIHDTGDTNGLHRSQKH